MNSNKHSLPKLLLAIILFISLVIFIAQKMSNFRLPDDFLGDDWIVNPFDSDTLK